MFCTVHYNISSCFSSPKLSVFSYLKYTNSTSNDFYYSPGGHWTVIVPLQCRISSLFFQLVFINHIEHKRMNDYKEMSQLPIKFEPQSIDSKRGPSSPPSSCLGFREIFFVYFFGDGLECVGHSLAYVAHFERCLESNPESCRSKQARYQFRHPSPFLEKY